MAFLAVSPGEYKNPQAVTNTIKYITRTRVNENRRGDLFDFGAVGVSRNPEIAIEQYKIVQRQFREPGNIGKRVFHETLQLEEGEMKLLNNAPRHIVAFANLCAYFYYNLGFQVVFAVHWDKEKKYHIHFVVNSVCFLNGRKWQNTYDKEEVRKAHFSYCLMWYHSTYIEPLTNIIQPISIERQLKQLSNATVAGNNRKFYVVARGKKCGIYEDYYDCQSQVENYKNPEWKLCTSLDAAYVYLVQELDYRDCYEIRIRGFSRWFWEYHSFLNFLFIFKDRYGLIPCNN